MKATKVNRTEKFYADLTNKIVGLMETEGGNWAKPWTATASAGMPHNVVTGRAYTGGNVMWLMLEAMDKGFASNEWATYKQLDSVINKGWEANPLDGMFPNEKSQVNPKKQVIRKGEKATAILIFKAIAKVNKETGEKERFFMARTYNVFNIAQLEEIPEKWIVDEADAPDPLEVDADALAWIDAIGADIRYGGDRAFFAIVQDYIQVPNVDDFHSAAGFFGTIAHELTHWTGHEDRLDREIANRFGSDKYAGEELVAELGAAFLSVEHGLTVEPRADHARYLNSWIKNLKEDPKAIYRASSAAVKAVEFLTEAAAVVEDSPVLAAA